MAKRHTYTPGVHAPSQERVVVHRWKLALTFGLLVLVIVFGSTISRYVPLDAAGEWLEGRGARGMVLFAFVGVLATSVGLPRQGLAFVGGLAWGVSAGVLLSLLAAIGGCALTSEVSRRYLARLIEARYPRFIAALVKLVERDAFGKIVALRLQPFGTNLITNLCAGLTPMSRRVFLSASLVGYIPQMLVFALLGAGVRVESQAQLTVSAVMLLISIGLGIWLYRRHLNAGRQEKQAR